MTGQNLDRFEELERLLSALADDQLDAAGRSRIGEFLDGDPEACEFYLDYISLHAHLDQELGSVEPLKFSDKLPQIQIEEATTVYLATRQPPPPPLWKQPWTLAAAAAVIAGALLISLMVRKENAMVSQRDANSATDNAVAVLTDTIDAQFAPGSLQPERGSRLLPKGLLKLESGLARLQFYSGAHVILQGPVEFELLGDNIAACTGGHFRASVPAPAQGFAVLTPQVELVDLGTEFGASIEGDGATEVHVFEGEVEVYDSGSGRDPEGRLLLTAGYGLQIGADGTKTDMLADSMAFVSEDEVYQRMRVHSAERHLAWQKFATESLSRDPRIIAHYPFESENGNNRKLWDKAELGGLRNGTIIGCQWVAGRWPGKRALEYKDPGDRVRIQIKENADSLTLVAWVKVNSLEQRFSALLLTDQLSKGGIEWQITRAGSLQFGIHKTAVETDSYISPIVFKDSIGKWTQVAVTLDHKARVVRHFLDGQLVSTHPLKSQVKLVVGGAQIGNWNALREGDSYPVRNINGRIDEFLMFNESIDADEIRDLYQVGMP